MSNVIGTATAKRCVRVISFIRQRLFARYIMVDLSTAVRSLGWEVQWLDLEGTLHATAQEPLDRKLRVISNTAVNVERFDPDVIRSYRLEYLEPVFQSYIAGVDTRFYEMLKRPAVFYLCDFYFPFDNGPDGAPAYYLAALQRGK